MAGYHSDGKPCRATVRACPLGEGGHFASPAEAAVASVAAEVGLENFRQEGFVRSTVADAEETNRLTDELAKVEEELKLEAYRRQEAEWLDTLDRHLEVNERGSFSGSDWDGYKEAARQAFHSHLGDKFPVNYEWRVEAHKHRPDQYPEPLRPEELHTLIEQGRGNVVVQEWIATSRRVPPQDTNPSILTDELAQVERHVEAQAWAREVKALRGDYSRLTRAQSEASRAGQFTKAALLQNIMGPALSKQGLVERVAKYNLTHGQFGHEEFDEALYEAYRTTD